MRSRMEPPGEARCRERRGFPAGVPTKLMLMLSRVIRHSLEIAHSAGKEERRRGRHRVEYVGPVRVMHVDLPGRADVRYWVP